MSDPLLFSVVIPTRARPATLAECLRRVAPGAQTLSADLYEVIVSDDAAGEGSARTLVAEQFTWARWVASSGAGPAANRNNGARFARGEWLVVTDDDCLPEPGWLEAFSKGIVPGVEALEGAIHPLGDIHVDMAHCPVNLEGGKFWTANVAIKRALFERLGGFDEHFRRNSEDQDMQARLSDFTKIRFVPDAIVGHPVTQDSLIRELRKIPVYCADWAHYVNKHSARLGRSHPVIQEMWAGIRFWLPNIARTAIRRQPRSFVKAVTMLVVGQALVARSLLRARAAAAPGERLRILSISNCPLVESQGSGYIILNFCEGLRARGHTVDLFGPDQYEPLRRVKMGKRYRQAVGMLWLVLKRLGRRYEVVEFYGAESWLAATVLSRLPKRSFLLVSHTNGFETYFDEVLLKRVGSTNPDGSPNRWYQINQSRLFEAAFKRVDGIVTLSRAESAFGIERRYQKASHLVAIEPCLQEDYLGLDVSRPRARLIGYCGSWLARKGSEVIQEDMTRILKEFPEWRFRLVGVGAAFRKEECFPRDVADRVEVEAFVTEKAALRAQYLSFSILIVPSVYESFGLVTAEGMACGCAVVAAKTGFAARLGHCGDAMLMDEPASPHLYANVKALIEDEALRQSIAAGGYKTAQSLRWPSAVEALETTYAAWLREFRRA